MSTEDSSFVKQITPMSTDFDRWYTDVIRKAELADYTPVAGSIVLRPYGAALWDGIRRAFDDMIAETGHENWYFPMLIPEDLLLKEADHIEGFAPEVAWVTRGGSDELAVPLAIRPTSETIIGTIVRRYIHSHRDLPLLTNQWCNVVRWEMRTRLFLRSREFLWQEGHTFHASRQEAEAEVATILECYRSIAEDWLAVPTVMGRKTESEKFAGAEYTDSIEGMMRDGQSLQMGTSHYLGQNFSRAYDVAYTSRENQRELCHTTSWGISWRMIGGLVMAHGDDSGLVMPPRIAPVQVAIVPIWRTPEEKQLVAEFIAPIAAALKGRVRHRVDWRDDVRPGEKYSHWEVRGVPFRIEVGPRDVAEGKVMLVDRLDRTKTPLSAAGLEDTLVARLDDFHARLFARALAFRAERTAAVDSLAGLVEFFGSRHGFVTAPWCGSGECEEAVKAAAPGVTARNHGFTVAEGDPGCLVCGARPTTEVTFARSY